MLDTAPVPTTTGTRPDITHVYCCNPDMALCGEDLSSQHEVDDDDQPCVVCSDLEDQECTCP
jgi:hypothetical protein